MSLYGKGPTEMLSKYILRMAEAGERTAFIEQGIYRSRVYSYARVVERARAFSSWLSERGLDAAGREEPPRVLLWAPPSAHWAMAFYGCILAGAVVVPIDAGFSADFLARVWKHTQGSLLITTPDMAARLPETSSPRFLLADLDRLPPAPASEDSAPAIKSDALAEIVYTSGTTAEPRGVMITHANLLANLGPIESELRRYRWLICPVSPLRFLNLVPLSHLFGQVMGLFIPQLVRGVVIFPEAQASAELARITRERRASVIVAVPRQLEALRQWAAGFITQANGGRPHAIDPDALPQLSIPGRWWKFRALHRALGFKMWCFVVGGAPLPLGLEEFWGSLGFAVVQGYGLTEAAPVIAFTHPLRIRHGSVGRTLAGTEARIAPDGEILVRGPHLSPGYYRDSAATEETLGEGWLRTGDLGRFDAEGNLIYLGRKKEVIVTADGLNVFPRDVERVLEAQPEVEEAAVVGKQVGAEESPQGNNGRTVVHAVLVPSSGAREKEIETAVARANQHLEPHQRIRGFSLWSQARLPRTLSTHKLQRVAIAAWANQAAARNTGASETLSPGLVERGATSDWRTFLAQLGLPAERLRPEARLGEDLGLSSIDRVELLTWLETHGHAVDLERFTEAQNLAEVEAAILDQEKKRAVPLASQAGPRDAPGQLEQKRSGHPPPASVEEPAWPRWKLVSLLRGALRSLVVFPLLRCYVKIEVEGGEKLEEISSPVIFVSNHQSLLDVAVILRVLPRPLRGRVAPAVGAGGLGGGAWRNLWSHPTGADPQVGETSRRDIPDWLLFLARFAFNGFLLRDDPAAVQTALRHVGKLAEEGTSTLIFPEGGRSRDGGLQPFRPGVGVMAERLDLPVVPICLEGLYEIWPRTRARPRRGRARVRVGEPLRIQQGENALQFAERLESEYQL